jgi:hypothetical protein
MPRAALFSRNQSPEDKPAHYLSRKFIPFLLALKIDGVAAAVALGPNKLQLNTDEPWIQTKRRFLFSQACIAIKVVPKPELCSPNESLDLAYPEPLRVTVHNPHPGFLAACQKARAANLQAKGMNG